MPDALIGPNAVTQLVAAARDQLGPAYADRMLRDAGLPRYIVQPPTKMVPEREVAALHSALAETSPRKAALKIAADAGVRTADYLLKNRIPVAARVALKCLPADLSARLLLRAISRHAWTFAGSGAFHFNARRPVSISISGSPLFADRQAAPFVDTYFRETFRRLFQVLVHCNCTCRDHGNSPMGSGGTRFALIW